MDDRTGLNSLNGLKHFLTKVDTSFKIFNDFLCFFIAGKVVNNKIVYFIPQLF